MRDKAKEYEQWVPSNECPFGTHVWELISRERTRKVRICKDCGLVWEIDDSD